jgi:hypothetical protein
MEQNLYPLIIILVSFRHKIPTKRVGLVSSQMSHPDIVLAYLIFLYLSGRHYRLRGRKTIADVAWCLIPSLT